MEVSGRRPHKQSSATGDGSSDEPQICAGCLEETGKAVEADGFCVTCNEFLCAPCYSIHRSPRPMKSHKLLDKHHMPERPFPPDERCPKHNENLLDHFCCSHNQLACSKCVRTDHNLCEDVDYIPDICDHVKTTTELEKTRDELAKLETEAETISTEIDSNANAVEQLKASVISEVKEFQHELLSHIEKRVEILEREIKQLTLQDKVKLQQIAYQSASLQSEIMQVINQLDMNEKYDRKLNLFTSMKNATSRISLLMDRLRQIKDSNTYNQYDYVRDPNLQATLEQPNPCIGHIKCVNDKHKSVNVPDTDSNLGITERMPKMKANERTTMNIVIEECNRSAKVTPEVMHDDVSSTVKQPNGDSRREARGENSNTAVVTETMAHGPLVGVGARTKNEQHTNKDTLGIEIKLLERDLSQEQSADKTRETERNETSATYHAEVARTLTCERKLTARLKSETNGCSITGMALLPGNRLVLVDNEHKVIKLLDTSNDTIISHISLEGYPWDVTVVSRDRLAVTLGGVPGKIQFVSVSGDRLSTDGQLRVSPGCRGIACHGSRLYVSYDKYWDSPAQVQVLDLQGRVLQTFVRDPAGQPLFDHPWYIAVSSDGNMYVSDTVTHTLTCLDPRGQVQWRNTDLSLPTGVVVDKYGTVYVAGYGSKNICVVSPAGNQLQVWGDDRIRFPYRLAFSEDGERLYVGMWMNNVLEYRVKLSESRCLLM